MVTILANSLVPVFAGLLLGFAAGSELEPHREYRSGHLYPGRLDRSLEPPPLIGEKQWEFVS